MIFITYIKFTYIYHKLNYIFNKLRWLIQTQSSYLLSLISMQKGKVYCSRHAAICVSHVTACLVFPLYFCSVMFKDLVKRLISYPYVTLPYMAAVKVLNIWVLNVFKNSKVTNDCTKQKKIVTNPSLSCSFNVLCMHFVFVFSNWHRTHYFKLIYTTAHFIIRNTILILKIQFYNFVFWCNWRH